MSERGRIIRGVGGLYGVVRDGPEAEGAGEFLCSARGLFRKREITPLVGDFVDFEADSIRPGYGSIVAILPRRAEFIRPPVANADQLLIILTLSVPAPDFLLADKLIIHALSNGIKPVLCFNKSDLPPEPAFSGEADGYVRAGFQTLCVSALEDQNMDALERALRGKVTILAGQSGVGKSTVFNRVLDDRKMAIGDMSRRIGRGRHTTRHVELTRLKAGGWLVDSPGFSLFEIEVGDYRGLDRFYPEFGPYRESCKFKECSHIHEPGCAVLEAFGEGALHSGRYGRYGVLYKTYKDAANRRYS